MLIGLIVLNTDGQIKIISVKKTYTIFVYVYDWRLSFFYLLKLSVHFKFSAHAHRREESVYGPAPYQFCASL